MERRQVAHLREDARWCVFREVASNHVPGDRTITVYECECRIAMRVIDFERDPASDETAPASEPEAGPPARPSGVEP